MKKTSLKIPEFTSDNDGHYYVGGQSVDYANWSRALNTANLAIANEKLDKILKLLKQLQG